MMKSSKQKFKCFIFPHSSEYFIGLHYSMSVLWELGILHSSHLPDQEVSGAYLCLEFIARQDPSPAPSVHSGFPMHRSPTPL